MAFQYIAIEGPIGAGKTSLARRLAERLDATTVLEDTDNPFLADFYAGKPGAALQTQLFYLLNRHRQQLSLRQGQLFSQVTIADYLFDKDKIFAYLNLDDNELFIYQRLYDLLAKDVPSPPSPGRRWPPGRCHRCHPWSLAPAPSHKKRLLTERSLHGHSAMPAASLIFQPTGACAGKLSDLAPRPSAVAASWVRARPAWLPGFTGPVPLPLWIRDRYSVVGTILAYRRWRTQLEFSYQ